MDVRLLIKAYRLGGANEGEGVEEEDGLDTVVCFAGLTTCEGEADGARRRVRDDVKKRAGPTDRGAAN